MSLSVYWSNSTIPSSNTGTGTAWVANPAFATPQSGFFNMYYDEPNGIIYYSSPYSVGFTTGGITTTPSTGNTFVYYLGSSPSNMTIHASGGLLSYLDVPSNSLLACHYGSNNIYSGCSAVLGSSNGITGGYQCVDFVYIPSRGVYFLICNNPTSSNAAYVYMVTESNGNLSPSSSLSTSSCQSIAYNPNSDLVYVGCYASLVVFSSTATPGGSFSSQKISIGAGVYTTMAYDGANFLYLGSSIGLGVQLSVSNYTITGLFFLFNTGGLATIRTVFIDNSGSLPATFWSTNQGEVARVNLRSFSTIFSSALTGNNAEDLHATFYSNATGLLFYSSISPGPTTDFHVYSVMKANCSYYSACADCLNYDQEYCGICLNTGLCTMQSQCNSGPWINGPGINKANLIYCPAAGPISPTMGTTVGGTIVTMTDSFFITGSPGQAGAHTCVWTNTADSSEVITTNPYQAPTTTTIKCQTPWVPSAGVWNLTIDYMGRQWLPAVPFTYYSCATFSCGTCGTSSDSSGCGWCFTTELCMPPSNGTNSVDRCDFNVAPGWTVNACPAASVSTPSVVAGESSAVSIAVTNFAPGSFSCDFGMYGIANATQNGSPPNSLSCLFPASELLGLGSYFFPVTVRTLGGVSIVTTSNSLELYNCTGITQCFNCTLPGVHTACYWCGNTTCQFASSHTCGTTPPCTTITSISPNISVVQSASNLLISIVGSNIDATATSCWWLLGLSALATPLQITSPTQASCQTPSTMGAGNWLLGLGSSSALETATVNFTVYDCSTYTTCTACSDPLYTDCSWCSDITSPVCYTGSVSCSNPLVNHDATQCPSLSGVIPDIFPLTGYTNITIDGDHGLTQIQAAQTSCAFTVGNVTSYSNITWLSSNELECDLVPSTPTSSNATLTLIATALIGSGDANSYINSLPVEYVTCGDFTTCEQCIGSPDSFCFWCGAICTSSCSITTPSGCPFISSISPNYSIITGGDRIDIYGGNFILPGGSKKDQQEQLDIKYMKDVQAASPYTCNWGSATTSTAYILSSDHMYCITLSHAADGVSPLTIDYNGLPYLTTSGIDFFTCPSLVASFCEPTCVSNEHCGWCVGSDSCGSNYQCSFGFQSNDTGCVFATPNTTVVPIAGSFISAFLSSPMPNGTDPTTLACTFGSLSSTFATSAATLDSDFQTFSCPTPAVSAPTSFQLGLTVSKHNYIEPVSISLIDCSGYTSCSTCIAKDNCGWCSQNSKCTMPVQCAASDWSNKSCPINKVALGVGLGVGLFLLLLLVLLAVFLIRRARERQGLIIDVKEPDYQLIAFGTDTTLAWRVPDHHYKLLETGLARRDFLLHQAIAFNCPSTEQDPIAKSLVYIAYAHGIGSEMIQTCIRAEVRACLAENTLFRNNSVASKMYKFFSRIVGIKYLFHCIARVIAELEVLGRQQNAGKTSDGESLLSMSMELDQTKAMDTENLDTDTNLIQLKLICQKLLHVIIKTSLDDIPPAFRKIFVEIDNSVMGRFAGSNDAVYKGIGGMFFLRFVCPAITAPHVYGLLEVPPNTTTQRQLVLISKTIQNIANMTEPGKKEEYMVALRDFITKSIPKIIAFYENLRNAVNVPERVGGDEDSLEVPENARLNALATIWNFMITDKDKILAWLQSSNCPFSDQEKTDLEQFIKECVLEYPTAPKKLKHGATAELEQQGKDKKDKKKKKT